MLHFVGRRKSEIWEREQNWDKQKKKKSHFEIHPLGSCPFLILADGELLAGLVREG